MPSNPFDSGDSGGSSAPAPDPLIGQSAQLTAETSKELIAAQKGIYKDQRGQRDQQSGAGDILMSEGVDSALKYIDDSQKNRVGYDTFGRTAEQNQAINGGLARYLSDADYKSYADKNLRLRDVNEAINETEGVRNKTALDSAISKYAGKTSAVDGTVGASSGVSGASSAVTSADYKTGAKQYIMSRYGADAAQRANAQYIIDNFKPYQTPGLAFQVKDTNGAALNVDPRSVHQTLNGWTASAAAAGKQRDAVVIAQEKVISRAQAAMEAISSDDPKADAKRAAQQRAIDAAEAAKTKAEATVTGWGDRISNLKTQVETKGYTVGTDDSGKFVANKDQWQVNYAKQRSAYDNEYRSGLDEIMGAYGFKAIDDGTGGSSGTGAAKSQEETYGKDAGETLTKALPTDLGGLNAERKAIERDLLTSNRGMERTAIDTETARASDAAGTDVNQAVSANNSMLERQARGMAGFDPTKFARTMASGGVNLRNLSLAGARTNAREMARREVQAVGDGHTANVINTGRGMASQGIQFSGASSGSAATGTGANATAVGQGQAAAGTLNQGYGTGIQGFGTAGQLMNSQYGNQVNAWGTKLKADQAESAGFGSMLGMAGRGVLGYMTGGLSGVLGAIK